ncbi:MAG: MFS transporter [Desulfobacterales bacterium]|nr:MFS transporter [Desulfobacterales bacterium]
MKELFGIFARLKPGWMGFSSGLLPLFMLAHFGHHLVNSLPIPLLPMIRQDFGLDYTQSGLLISAFSLSYGLSQFPAGWLADRVGPRILLFIGISGVAMAGLLAGLSQSYGILLVCLVAMGITGGGYHPAAPPLISAAVEPKNRGRAMGLHMLGGSIPFFLAPLIAVALTALWGWRASFIVLAVPTILLGGVLYVVLGRRLKARAVESAAAGSKGGAEGSAHGNFHQLAPIIIISTFAHAVTFCMVAFIPLFLVDRFGLEKEAAAVFLSIFYSAGLWASLMGGILSDRLGSVPVVLTVCFITGPVIYLLNFMPAALGVGGILFVLGICNYIRTPVTETYLVSRTSEKNRSKVLGVYYFSNIEGGGVLTPVLGFLIDRYGFYTSFSIAGTTVFVLFLICWVWLRGSRNK